MASINPFYAAYQANPARIALEEMKSYCAAHPGSPSATRRPALSIRSGLWIALLGPCLEEGIVGIGYTVELALRAFDTQYMARQHSPSEPDENRAVGKRAHRMPRLRSMFRRIFVFIEYFPFVFSGCLFKPASH